MEKFKKLILTLIGTFIIIGVGTVKAKANSFAVYYIDMQKLINESPQGKKAKTELEAEIKKAESQLKKLAKEIEQLKKELSSPLISQKTKQQKETEIQTKILQYKQLQQKSQKMLSKFERELTAKILKDVFKIVEKYRKEHNIPMIVEKNEAGIISADPKYDLTDKILKLYSRPGK
ncbi:OmpH family outer membrane protein [Desulfurobacterium sp.]|uniref:OmpH family outer membrane protein n=1 Tax=Desulfurobacterium sp. TaxID=2004706 RepID=UPI002604DF4D|nr:OmpH family outer membrane protein [Desulfurobacterium sp.]